jgi:rhodanese-related sulfurtransferase
MGSLPPKNNEIIIIDQNGNDAAKSAMLLKQMGFENISILIEGIDRILSLDSRDLKCKNEFYINPVSYQLFNSTEFGRYARNTKDIVLLDIRTEDEFSNKAKDSWRNIGRLNGAINIPADQLATRFQELDKNKDIVIYGFSSGAEVFRAAALLTKNNFSKLHLLAGGIFNVRWSAGNVKGESYLKDFVVDVPEVNQ